MQKTRIRVQGYRNNKSRKKKKKQRMQTGLVTNASPYIHKGGTQKLREVACFVGEFMFKRF